MSVNSDVFERIARSLELLNNSLTSIKDAIESLELMDRCRFYCGEEVMGEHSEHCSFEEDGIS